jgi:DNA modification methylase
MKPYYEDSAVTIYHGDCRELIALWPGTCADAMLTDPPYSPHTHSKQWIDSALTDAGAKRVSTKHKSLGFDPLTDELRGFICEHARRIVKRWTLAFCDVESAHLWRDDFRAAGLDYVRTCFWDKVDSAPQFTGDRPAASVEGIVCAHVPGKKRWNGGGRRNCFRHPVNGEHGAKPHPSTKPENLMRELVGLFTDEREIVLDPFMGSGTTLRAAKDLGRRAIGIELEERYCEIAARRMGQEVLPLTAA